MCQLYIYGDLFLKNRLKKILEMRKGSNKHHAKYFFVNLSANMTQPRKLTKCRYKSPQITLPN